jgi:hypothetical protein
MRYGQRAQQQCVDQPECPENGNGEGGLVMSRFMVNPKT